MASQSTSGRIWRQEARTSTRVRGCFEPVGTTQLASDRERLVPQQIDVRVVGGETARGRLQLLAADVIPLLGEFGESLAQLAGPVVPGVERLAIAGDLFARAVVEAAARNSPDASTWRYQPTPGAASTNAPWRGFVRAFCPSRTGCRGRAGTPSRNRTPPRVRRRARRAEPAPNRRTPACGRSRTSYCCRPRGPRRNRARPPGFR